MPVVAGLGSDLTPKTAKNTNNEAENQTKAQLLSEWQDISAKLAVPDKNSAIVELDATG